MRLVMPNEPSFLFAICSVRRSTARNERAWVTMAATSAVNRVGSVAGECFGVVAARPGAGFFCYRIPRAGAIFWHRRGPGRRYSLGG